MPVRQGRTAHNESELMFAGPARHPVLLRLHRQSRHWHDDFLPQPVRIRTAQGVRLRRKGGALPLSCGADGTHGLLPRSSPTCSSSASASSSSRLASCSWQRRHERRGRLCSGETPEDQGFTVVEEGIVVVFLLQAKSFARHPRECSTSRSELEQRSARSSTLILPPLQEVDHLVFTSLLQDRLLDSQILPENSIVPARCPSPSSRASSTSTRSPRTRTGCQSSTFTPSGAPIFRSELHAELTP